MLIRNDIARRLPDFRLCITCSQLHRINFDEEPVLSEAQSNYCRRSLATVPENVNLCNQKIAYHVIGDQTTYWPKIVQGRFILKLCRVFTTWTDKVCLDSLTGPFGRLCQHLTFIDGENGRLGREIKAALEEYECKSCAAESTIQRRFSCNSCPTDIELEIGAEHARFLVWYDLGTGNYPVDKLWLSRTHVFPFGQIPPTFDHKHGSIRESEAVELFKRGEPKEINFGM
ncbi:hypothetical protein E6O75_ATG06158 [Venturia nashicola]|uniref:Uncharacterized protein n=1 Tax=Venturia nashicola TaxID=86259 RepID=A0A4Z1NWP2_9PEZI|nr:hypothetical protein E6O75_ATG06158 [Venturia nashicola]